MPRCQKRPKTKNGMNETLKYNFSSFTQNYNWKLETLQLILLLAAGLPFWQSEHSEKLQYAWSRNFQSYFDNTKVNVKSMYVHTTKGSAYCYHPVSIAFLMSQFWFYSLFLAWLVTTKMLFPQVTFLSKIVIMLP